jgi:VWFA-related protein
MRRALERVTGRVRAAFTAAAVGSVVLASAAQQPSPPAKFASGIELVPVDFYAVTSDGNPIADLKPEEVTVRIGGRSRTLRSLQWIQVDDSITTAGMARVPVPPAPFGSNAASDAGRGLLIALDHESLKTGREAPLRAAVHKLLMSLAPRDRVALVTMPYGGLKVDFTREHDRVSQAFSQIVGQADRNESGRDAACRTRRTLEALGGLLDGLSSPDAPTTVVFITTSLAGPRRDAPMSMAPGQCELRIELFQQVGLSAAAARAHFYIVQPEDPSPPTELWRENIAGAGFTGSENPYVGIEHLSGATGARRLHLASQGPDTLLRVMRETAGYYLAGIEPERSDRGGEKHKVDVEVSRPGVVLRTRPDIFIARADARARDAALTPRSMLREARMYRDLPLRAVGYTSNSRQGRLKVVVLAEPIDPTVTFRSAMVGLFDLEGRLVAQGTVESNPRPGVPVMTALEIEPGRYRLRVAATDATGRGGTVDYQVNAELSPAGPLALSSMMLGLSRPGGFVPRLVFGPEPVALAYLEVYGAPAGSPVSIVMELATTVDGPPLLRIPGAVDSVRRDSQRIATGAIPIAGLKPGDYVIRAVVQAEGQPAGRVVGTLRKEGY